MRLSLFALALIACGSSQVPGPFAPGDELPPPNRVVPSTPDDALACDHLVALRCPEGRKLTCLAAFSRVRTDNVGTVTRCVLDAPDVAAVRRCGGPDTLTIECVQ